MKTFIATDINECEEDVCGSNEICVNTVGSFICQCQEGYKRNQGDTCEGMMNYTCSFFK